MTSQITTKDDAAPSSGEFQVPHEVKVKELFKLIHESFEENGSVPQNLLFLGDGPELVDSVQIGIDEGFVNYIYRLSQENKSVVVKWARDTPRVAEAENIEMTDQVKEDMGEISLDRNAYEYKSLKKIEELVPGSIPELYWLDKKRHFFIMEDLKNYDTLRQKMTNGVFKEEVCRRFARFQAQLHRETHVDKLSAEEFEDLCKEHRDDSRVEQITNWLYELGLSSEIPIPIDREYCPELKAVLPEVMDNAEVRKMLQGKLLQTFRHTHLAFVHNDPHPGAVMVNDKDDIKIIDPEFSYVGCPAREVGYALAEVIMFFYIHKGLGKPDVCQAARNYTRIYIEEYLAHMGEYAGRMEEFMPIVAGQAGMFAAMRTAGLLQFPQFVGLGKEEAECALVAARLIKEMETVTSLEKFLNMCYGTS